MEADGSSRRAGMVEAGRRFETDDRRIAFDTVRRFGISADVSTVFLGLDHGWGDGPPILFETMIFGGPHDQRQWRYSTIEEAREGHKAAVRLASRWWPTLKWLLKLAIWPYGGS